MKVKDEILARMYVLLTLLALLPGLVAVQMVRLTVIEGPELRAQGESQATRTETVPAMRGRIVDRAGRTLVVNTARYDIAVDPTVAGFDTESGRFFDLLARSTGESTADLRERVRRRTSRAYVLLERGVDEDTRDRLLELGTPGLIVTSSNSRRYSYGTTAAHLLGHVNVDLEGLAGIEARYDDALSGTDGWRSVQLDRRRVVKYAAEEAALDPVHGETVVLTLDLVRQSVLEEELERGVLETGANWGTGIAMDPRTGEILALANFPTFDPNRAGAHTDAERRNHAVTDRLEPGSTFKLVAAAAAIEQGVIGMQDTVDTGPGWIVQHGITLRDTRPHGRIPFAEVLSESSNIGIALVAEKLQPDVLYRYARALGFGTPTWIDLPGEVSGTLRKTSEWSGTTRSAMSRGYEVEITPMQLLVAYGALARGGILVQPHVVAERRDVTGRVTWRARQDSIRKAFEPSTARTLIPAFERAVAEGTGRNARVDGVRIAGKTGTAWKTRDGQYEAGAYRSSFVGFYPVEDPSVVMVVLLDEPRTSVYGGAAAAPIFSRTVARWLVTMPEVAAKSDSLVAALPDPQGLRTIPDVRNLPEDVAARRLRSAGYDASPEPRSVTALVALQRPEAGAPAYAGTRIRLEGSEKQDADRMPDVTGLTVREAVWLLSGLGITPIIRGSGIVQTQSLPAGGPLQREVTIECR